MTTPLHPPGLSLSHLSSRLALSTPSILSLVLTHLVELSQSTDASTTSVPPHYTALRAASLVARCWADAARPLLHRTLVFTRGDEQLRGWIYAVECAEKRAAEGGAALTSEVVVFVDKATEGFGGEGGRWNVEVAKEVLERVKGVKGLVVTMMGVRELPGELLACEGLKDLVSFTTTCPFILPPSTTKPPILPFKLHQLVLRPVDPHQPFSSWLSTVSLLSPALTSLRELDLSHFAPHPSEPLFFPSLMPTSNTLTILKLPHLALTPSSYRLALFAATGLPSLTTLVLASANAYGIREVLPYFGRIARALKALVFQQFLVPFGAGLVLSDDLLEYPDTVRALADVLDKWPTRKEGGTLQVVALERVQVKDPSWMHLLHRVGNAAKSAGACLQVSRDLAFEEELKPAELKRLAELVERSKQHIRKVKEDVQRLESAGDALLGGKRKTRGRIA
ncbi:hypothetical protein JCM6882_000612 [Rhodosporidiobolus microsporus]